MWCNTACAAGGLIAACAAAYLVPSFVENAGATTFEARWQAAGPGLKADRISGPRNTGRDTLFSFSVPSAQTSVIMKKTPAPPETRQKPVRTVPQDVTGKDKLPVGCEPSFSPVTMPSLAHVSGRCLS